MINRTINFSLQSFLLKALLSLGLWIAPMVSPEAHTHGVSNEISSPADSLEQKNSAKELTQQLAARIAEFKSATASGKSEIASHLMKLAQARQKLLFDLIENDPNFVLNQSLPGKQLEELPEPVRSLIEQTEDIEGELVVIHIDHKDPNQSRYRHYINTTNGERISIHFADHIPGLESGVMIQAHGTVINRSEAHSANETDAAMVVESGDNGLLILEQGKGNTGNNTGSGTTAGAVSSTLGEQRTLVLLVNFQDAPTEPYSIDYARSVVFGDTSNFFLENSNQQTWLSGDVKGWFTISLSSTVCDIDTLASQAKSAATSSGVVLSNYNRIVYAFPKNGCGGLGVGTVGGNPSQAWIIGTLNLSVLSHELGHNLGLYHAKGLDCGTTVLGDSCTVMAYGNAFDTMGNTNPGHYNAFMKERLGWLNAGNSPEIVTVQSDGTYLLDAYESAGTGPKALKILKSIDPATEAKTWYYIESRQAIGFDTFLSDYPNVLSGVLISTGTEANGDSSYLLDMTPASQLLTTKDWRDPTLTSGTSFVDAGAGITVTADSVSATGAAVTVMFSGGSSGTSSPTVSISTDLASYTKGQTVTITAKVSSGVNPVSNASVSFKITKSDGSISTASATTGSNGSAVYKLRLRKLDPSGIYKAETIATMDGMSAGAATQFTVQ